MSKPSEEALQAAKRELDRIEGQERPDLSIWANSPANIHDLAALLDAYAARKVTEPSEGSLETARKLAFSTIKEIAIALDKARDEERERFIIALRQFAYSDENEGSTTSVSDAADWLARNI